MGKTNLLKIIILLLLIAGMCLLGYPFVCNAINQYKNDRSISEYESVMDSLSEVEAQTMIDEARAYNREHPSIVIIDTFEYKNSGSPENNYQNILNPIGDGSMGYIQIPKINVRLVIYHGTSEDILTHGCGHLQGSHLPVGGDNTHCILAAHRGLPTAKLFTDIDRIVKGDQFYINVAYETMAYEVDSIVIVKPEDLSSLENSNDDRVTLLTCTPYGVNSHRLLVSGHRVPYVEAQETKQNHLKALIIISAALLLMLVVVIALCIRKRLGGRS